MAQTMEINGLNKKQLDELRESLLEKRQVLIKSVEILRARATEINPDDIIEEIDQATANQIQTVQLRVLDKEYKLLREVNRALEKFDAGEYGLCEGTEEPIGYPRLRVRPWARYSIDYAEEKERVARQVSSRLPGR